MLHLMGGRQYTGHDNLPRENLPHDNLPHDNLPVCYFKLLRLICDNACIGYMRKLKLRLHLIKITITV